MSYPLVEMAGKQYLVYQPKGGEVLESEVPIKFLQAIKKKPAALQKKPAALPAEKEKAKKWN